VLFADVAVQMLVFFCHFDQWEKSFFNKTQFLADKRSIEQIA